MENYSIGKTIAALRKEKGWTQSELAEKLQVSDKAVSKWEQDNGMPSVEFFPKMAQIFGVSIDYLMTGQAPEKEIVTMSKAELCAKEDNPSLIENLSFHMASQRDDDGKTLMEYIIQYNSTKVLTAMIDSCRNSQDYKKLAKAVVFTEEDKKTTTVPYSGVLEKRQIAKLFAMLVPIDREGIFIEQGLFFRSQVFNTVGGFCWILFEIRDTKTVQVICDYLISHYDELPTEKLAQYICLDGEEGLSILDKWSLAYPYFVEAAYRFNKRELAISIAERIVKSNKYVIRREQELKGLYEIRQDRYSSENLEVFRQKYHHIYFLESTRSLCIAAHDFEFAKAMGYNEKQFQSETLESNLSENLEKALIVRFTEQRLIIVDELLQKHYLKTWSNQLEFLQLLRDQYLPVYQSALDKGFIHYYEMISFWVQQKQYKDLFEFSVDYSISSLQDAVLECNDNKILEVSKNIFIPGKDLYKKFTTKLISVDKFIQTIVAQSGEPVKQLIKNQYRNFDYDFDFYANDIMNLCKIQKNQKYNSRRKKILDEIETITGAQRAKEEYDRICNEISYEYLMQLINSRQYDFAVIKLCVKLEAIFKYKFKYDGDFKEMLDTYINQNLRLCNNDDYEDNDYYSDKAHDEWCSKTTTLLNKLRMYRNQVVHSGDSTVELLPQELIDCIDIVSNIQKEKK